MKAVIKTGPVPGAIYTDVERPKPKPDEVLIEVRACAVCGTDLGLYKWNKEGQQWASNFNVTWPLTLGHEFSGVIVEMGEAVKDRHIGQRVALETHMPCFHCYNCENDMSYNCMDMGAYGTTYNGSFADYAMGPANLTYPLPDEMSFEVGALLEGGGAAMRAVEEAHVQPGETVVVSGCGAIGLFAIMILKSGNAARVIATDMDEYRLNLARQFGAIAINITKDDPVKAIKELTARRGGADVVIEASGAAAAYNSLFKYLRREGRLVTVGHPGGEIHVNWMNDVNLKGISIKGIFGRKIWKTWYELTDLETSGRINLIDVVTHRFPLSQTLEGFEQCSKGAGKVMILPD